MSPFGHDIELERIKGRYAWFMAAITLAFLFVAGKLYLLQVSRGDEFRLLSATNIVDDRREVAYRGLIFDRNKVLLVDNQPAFNLLFRPAYCDKKSFPGMLNRLSSLAVLTDEEREKIEDAYQRVKGLNRYLPVLVRRELSRAELAAVEQHRSQLDGIEMQVEVERAFPKGRLASHLLGYVGEISEAELKARESQAYLAGDITGKSGVEYSWEATLRGQNGLRRIVVDSRGQRIPESIARQVRLGPEYLRPNVPGANLILSIDARLQRIAEERFPGIEGAVVAVDPQTGFILAMVSKPDYDPNRVTGHVNPRWWREMVEDPDKPLLNRATQQHYPPGSTFKAFTGLAALQTGAFDQDTKQVCAGGLKFGGHLFRCWRGGGHGSISMHRAVVQSCDVYFYRAGIEAGIDEFAKVARDFGMGEVSGFDSAREVPGIIPDRQWYQKHTKTGFLPGFTLSAAIGQGDVNVTPLQLAMAYGAIGNGGRLYRPQVVERIEAPNGTVLERFEPQLRRHVDITPENLRVMADGLTGVANEPGGTAYYRRPQGVSFQVAGKTGTAQVIKQGDDRGRDLPYDFRDHAWFVGYAPADNPRIVVAVVNEHGGHGSSSAAPLVMELIAYYMEQIQAREGTEPGRQTP